MGNWTHATLKVYEIPEGQREVALEVISAEGFAPEWEGEAMSLEPGSVFVYDAADGDLAETMAEVLSKVAPGATFAVHTDPSEDWVGSGAIYAPDLGVFKYESDSDGTPEFTHWHITKWMDGLAPNASLDEAKAAIDKAAGGPWLRRIKDLGQKLGK